MNFSRSKLRIASIAIVLILVIAGIAGGAIQLFQSSCESEVKNAEISGYIYDSQSGIGLIDEVCVILDKENSSFEWQMFWPGDPDNRGFFNFSELGPGTYSITLGRSWVMYNLGEDEPVDFSWAGWDLSGRYYIDVKPAESVTYDIYLDFFCDKSWPGAVDNLRLMGSGGTVFGWGSTDDTSWFGHNSNLIGKTMTIDVEWANTALTRTDFNIIICDLASAEDTQYEMGSQRESITWDLTEDYLDHLEECPYVSWRVRYDSLASIETSDISYTIFLNIE